MTNYLRSMVAIGALCAAACAWAATANQPAPATAAAPGAIHYVQANGSALTFTFKQADAANSGGFGQFATTLDYDEKNPAAGKLDVTVQIGSVATRDKDRDDTLKSADMLDAGKFPTARYSATSFAKTAGGALEAVGKLTLRGVTRDLRLPLKIRAVGGGLELSGEVTIKRLDYGVGQGEWKSTEMVGDEVKLQYKVALKAG